MITAFLILVAVLMLVGFVGTVYMAFNGCFIAQINLATGAGTAMLELFVACVVGIINQS